MKDRNSDLRAIGVILLAYIAGLFIFESKLHFPWGDTWFYTLNVKHSIEQGKVTFTGAQAAMPWFQVWLGSLVCKLTGGVGFFKLNLMTYIFSFASAVITYKFIRLFTSRNCLALLGTLILIGMPPFMKMSLGFMTDIYFYFGMILAFYYGVKLILNGGEDIKAYRICALLTGIGFAIAILSRTNALVTYVAFLGYLIINRKKFKFDPWVCGFSLIPMAAFLLFQLIPTPFQAVLIPRIFARDMKAAFTTAQFLPFIGQLGMKFVKWIAYFGALLLPVTLWQFIISAPKWRSGDSNELEKRDAMKVWLVLAPLTAIVAFLLMRTDASRLILPNTISGYGMGVKGEILPGSALLLGKEFFGYLKPFLTIGGILLLLAGIGRILSGIKTPGPSAFLWWMLIATGLFPILTNIFSDRYLIPILPIMFAIFAGGADKEKKTPLWLWIFPLALIMGSGLLANDYLGWNKALWKSIPGSENVLSEMETDDALTIEAGLEYTSLRYFDDARFVIGAEETVWERPDPNWEDAPKGLYPWYLISYSLPRLYDVYVREDYLGMPFAAGPNIFAEWDTVSGESYRPFPWSEPRRFVLYLVPEAEGPPPR